MSLGNLDQELIVSIAGGIVTQEADNSLVGNAMDIEHNCFHQGKFPLIDRPGGIVHPV